MLTTVTSVLPQPAGQAHKVVATNLQINGDTTVYLDSPQPGKPTQITQICATISKPVLSAMASTLSFAGSKELLDLAGAPAPAGWCFGAVVGGVTCSIFQNSSLPPLADNRTKAIISIVFACIAAGAGWWLADATILTLMSNTIATHIFSAINVGANFVLGSDQTDQWGTNFAKFMHTLWQKLCVNHDYKKACILIGIALIVAVITTFSIIGVAYPLLMFITNNIIDTNSPWFWVKAALAFLLSLPGEGFFQCNSLLTTEEEAACCGYFKNPFASAQTSNQHWVKKGLVIFLSLLGGMAFLVYVIQALGVNALGITGGILSVVGTTASNIPSVNKLTDLFIEKYQQFIRARELANVHSVGSYAPLLRPPVVTMTK